MNLSLQMLRLSLLALITAASGTPAQPQSTYGRAGPRSQLWSDARKVWLWPGGFSPCDFLLISKVIPKGVEIAKRGWGGGRFRYVSIL